MNGVIAGALLNSALFLVGVFTAGLVAHDNAAVLLSLMSAGACAFCYAAQAAGKTYQLFTIVTCVASRGLGMMALVALFLGYIH